VAGLEENQGKGLKVYICVRVLVQKLKDNCNESTNLGHTVTITLKRVRDWYGKGKCIQMEALSA
jgi:hypothetical protein